MILLIREPTQINSLSLSLIIFLNIKDDLNDPDNFRPFSIIPVLGKGLELENKSLLSAAQFAFRNNYSTLLVRLVDDIVDNFDDEITLATMCDLSTAFDCV